MTAAASPAETPIFAANEPAGRWRVLLVLSLGILLAEAPWRRPSQGDLGEYPSAGRPQGRRVMKRYAVVFERAPRGFGAFVPDLPGCVATGRTREVVERRIREAIELHLAGMQAARLPIPEPSAWTGAVEV
jgi:predicted RNase H-like HicB family nuclease